ncbi:apolipoprotein N-acyltransferase [Pseudomonas sp. F1_0610]|uniref:apolipoprotein N-acyltransferase n=1 Tax=Pseudomonas sp. F1_0610 TaxID=3114284 RepID=UPI0039C28624
MPIISRAGWLAHFIAFISGSLITLSLAPFNLWPLAILSVALLYLGLDKLGQRAAMARSWWFGFGLFASGASWVYVSIHQFGSAPPILAGILTLLFVAGLALFFIPLGYLWARWLRTNNAFFNIFSFAALWVALEIFRGWFLTGFPWLYLGYSQTSSLLRGLAPLGGVWLISFVLALTATAIVYTYQHRILGTATLCLIWLASTPLVLINWTTPSSKPLSVLAVQGNIDQNMKWDSYRLSYQLALYRDMTIAQPRADLIIWPETAVPINKDRAEVYLAGIQAWALRQESGFITGIPMLLPDETGKTYYYNGVTAGALAQGDYLKQKLVPFGEYVPLQDSLRGLIDFFDLPMSDFRPGPKEQSLLSLKDQKIAPFICYEVVYPDFAAGLSAQSNVLLTISNDAWFGESIGPIQHLQMAQMRAIEAGRWMIRSTNNGISALIDPQGKVITQAPQFEQTVLTGNVIPMQGLTPYLRFKSWPLLILISFLLASAFLLAKKYKKTISR